MEEKHVVLLKGNILRYRRVSLKPEQMECLKDVIHLSELDALVGDKTIEVAGFHTDGEFWELTNWRGGRIADHLAAKTCEVDSFDGDAPILRIFQRTAHAWFRTSLRSTFDLDRLSFQETIVGWGNGSMSIAVPSYGGTAMSLVYPPSPPPYQILTWPSDDDPRFQGEALAWNYYSGPVLAEMERDSETIPVTVEHRTYRDEGDPALTAYPNNHDDAEITTKLRQILGNLAKQLLGHDIVLVEVHAEPGTSLKEYEPGAYEQVRGSSGEICETASLAWFSITTYEREEAEEEAIQRYDPEHMIEEPWAVIDYDQVQKPSVERVVICFRGEPMERAAEVGAIIARLAEQVGLQARWNGNPEIAVEVRLP